MDTRIFNPPLYPLSYLTTAGPRRVGLLMDPARVWLDVPTVPGARFGSVLPQ